MIVTLGVGALFAWRLYGRLRRVVGRQHFSRGRSLTTLCLFLALAALLAFGALGHADSILALVGGLVAGAALGAYGLKLTKFEQTSAGLFYTPNTHLGIALTVLLIARISYRFAVSYAAEAPPAGLAQGPLTLVIFGTLAGYYIAYAVGLLRWQRRVTAAGQSPEIS
jgi:hypothetical protein